MKGQVFMVVGPSGAGKDTLIDAALLETPHIMRIQRIVTRDPNAGGEEVTSVTQDEFDQMAAQGDFAYKWHAHSLSYGIPKSVYDYIENNQSILFNGSRTIIDKATEAFPDLHILSIEANQDVLRTRLLRRARETPEAIERRLKRADLRVPETANVTRIINNGSLEQATRETVRALTRRKGTRP